METACSWTRPWTSSVSNLFNPVEDALVGGFLEHAGAGWSPRGAGIYEYYKCMEKIVAERARDHVLSNV